MLRASVIFDGVLTASLDKGETEYLLEFVQQIPGLVLEQIDVEQERKAALERRDMENPIHEEPDELDSEFDQNLDNDMADVVRSARMVDVVGQILRNRARSFEKEQLVDLARSGYQTGLRFLSWWLDITRREKSQFVSVVAQMLKGKLDGGRDEEKLRKAATRLYLNLAYDVCRGVVKRIANSLGSKELIEIFARLEDDPGESIAVRLINVAIRMEFGAGLPKKHIEALQAGLSGDPVTERLLRELVVQHLYLHEVDVGDKQWISSKLGIPMAAQRRLARGNIGRKRLI